MAHRFGDQHRHGRRSKDHDCVFDFDDDALMNAVGAGCVACVDFLIRAGADVNSRDVLTHTPLMKASRRQHVKCLKLLLDAGADVNMVDNEGNTALTYAVEKISLDNNNNNEDEQDTCVKLLLKALQNENCTNPKDGETPLMSLAKYGNLEFLKTLITSGADVNEAGKDGFTPLINAAVMGNDGCVVALIQAGANVNATTKNEFNALMLAARQLNDTTVEVLRKMGAVVNEEYEDVPSILLKIMMQMGNVFNNSVAIERGFRCLQIVIAAGAPVNECENMNSLKMYLRLLHYVIRPRHGQIALLLTAAGETIDEPSKQEILDDFLNEDVRREGSLKSMCRDAIRKHLLEINPRKNLFMRAPRLQIPATLKDFLLYDVSLDEEYLERESPQKDEDLSDGDNISVDDENHGYNITDADYDDEEENSDLTDSVDEDEKVEAEEVDEIIHYQFMEDIENMFRKTPMDTHKCLKVSEVAEGKINSEKELILAAEYGCEKCVHILIEGGADVNKTDENKATALIRAAKYGFVNTVNLLIESGADVDILDKYGKTALGQAAKYQPNEWDMHPTGGSHKECVVSLLKTTGADVNKCPEGADTPLMSLATFGDAVMLKSLIEAGADVNGTNKFGQTALICAVQKGQDKCVEVLIDAGADVNASVAMPSHDRSVLSEAVGTTNLDIKCVDLLIQAGADVKHDQVVLISAATNITGNAGTSGVLARGFRCLQILLSSEVPINKVNTEGKDSLECFLEGYHHTFICPVQYSV